jgi:hypothetical protein
VWSRGWRSAWWLDLGRPVDLVVVGGGIVGAGIAWAAAERGLSVRLVEQSDFNAGTSSRSSKFVHGGLRYLKNGPAISPVSRSLPASGCSRRERGLVTPIRFLMTHYDGIPPGLRFTKAVLTAYDVSGRRRTLVCGARQWPTLQRHNGRVASGHIPAAIALALGRVRRGGGERRRNRRGGGRGRHPQTAPYRTEVRRSRRPIDPEVLADRPGAESARVRFAVVDATLACAFQVDEALSGIAR